MQLLNKRLPGVLSIMLGITFLASGFLKSNSSIAFAEQLSNYGMLMPKFLSLLIIIIETLLGIVLIMGVWLKKSAAISAVILVIFTIGYTYGLLFHNISSCGCFGDSKLFNSPPLWIYIRNSILLLISLFVSFCSPVKSPSHKTIQFSMIVMIAGGCLVSYLSGLSSRSLSKNSKIENRKSFELSDSPLNGLLKTHPDSTYIVFAFSYSCPHCLNSIANLNEYNRLHLADKILGINRETLTDSVGFEHWFSPSFQIIKSDKAITKELPTLYYIRNDSIITTIIGELPSAFIFSEIIGYQ